MIALRAKLGRVDDESVLAAALHHPQSAQSRSRQGGHSQRKPGAQLRDISCLGLCWRLARELPATNPQLAAPPTRIEARRYWAASWGSQHLSDRLRQTSYKAVGDDARQLLFVLVANAHTCRSISCTKLLGTGNCSDPQGPRNELRTPATAASLNGLHHRSHSPAR